MLGIEFVFVFELTLGITFVFALTFGITFVFALTFGITFVFALTFCTPLILKDEIGGIEFELLVAGFRIELVLVLVLSIAEIEFDIEFTFVVLLFKAEFKTFTRLSLLFKF